MLLQKGEFPENSSLKEVSGDKLKVSAIFQGDSVAGRGRRKRRKRNEV